LFTGHAIFDNEQSTSLAVQTRESDEEGEEARDSSVTGHGASYDEAHHDAESSNDSDEDDLEEGMLPRDLPRRTTFYDPVAERQMSQTDAKAFYHRSKVDLRNGAHPASHSTPLGSPVVTSSSHPATEYGADSLVLDLDPRRQDSNGPGLETFDSILDKTSTIETAENMHTQHGINHADHPPSIPARVSQGPPGVKLPESSNPVFTGSGLFDTEPHITTELSAICQNIQRILDVRRKYIALSFQGPDDNPRDDPEWDVYPPPPQPAWKKASDGQTGHPDHVSTQGREPWHGAKDDSQPTLGSQDTKRPTRRRKPGQDIGEDFDMGDLSPLPGDDGMTFKLDDSGVYQVFEDESSQSPAIQVPTIREFYMDLDDILNVSSDGPSKSFAFRRLQYLEGKFNLYVLLNEYQETADCKKVPHRDFYNVRKVDTHVHHSACMNQKHLLRFIKSKMKKFPNEVVLFRDGRHLTLAEVFASINLTAYDLSIDTLDMHVSVSFFNIQALKFGT
jgi:AMP deaminase